MAGSVLILIRFVHKTEVEVIMRDRIDHIAQLVTDQSSFFVPNSIYWITSQAGSGFKMEENHMNIKIASYIEICVTKTIKPKIHSTRMLTFKKICTIRAGQLRWQSVRFGNFCLNGKSFEPYQHQDFFKHINCNKLIKSLKYETEFGHISTSKN